MTTTEGKSRKKKKSKMLPAERSMIYIRKRPGYLLGAKVERWNPFVVRPDGGKGIRQDLFGLIDVLVLWEDRSIWGIQATASHKAAEHRAKITSHRNFAALQQSAITLVLHSWRQKPDGRWVLKEEVLSARRRTGRDRLTRSTTGE